VETSVRVVEKGATMARGTCWSLAATCLAGTILSSSAAFADDEIDTPAAVQADCSRAGLTRDEITLCLERVRLISESTPSRQLQLLETQLTLEADQTPGDKDVLTRSSVALGLPDTFADPPRTAGDGTGAIDAFAVADEKKDDQALKSDKPEFKQNDDTQTKSEDAYARTPDTDGAEDIGPTGNIPEDEEKDITAASSPS
jgi:hypothetical protein